MHGAEAGELAAKRSSREGNHGIAAGEGPSVKIGINIAGVRRRIVGRILCRKRWTVDVFDWTSSEISLEVGLARMLFLHRDLTLKGEHTRVRFVYGQMIKSMHRCHAGRPSNWLESAHLWKRSGGESYRTAVIGSLDSLSFTH